MLNEKENSSTIFSGKVRVRVCGLLIQEKKILLIKHDSIGELGYFWSPPGGGVEFGATLEETLVREFKEETNLEVAIDSYLFANEFIDDHHHAIELFFKVIYKSGEMKLGVDPELDDQNQILTNARFFSKRELDKIPEKAIHNAFITAKTRDKIVDLRGLITFKH